MSPSAATISEFAYRADEIREQIAKALKVQLKAQLQTSELPAEVNALLAKEDGDLATRDFLTMAIKSGTGALKSDTGTTLFNQWMRSFERAEASCKAAPRRVRTVPYTKATARTSRDGSFDPKK
ncbi:hypothetical protein PHO31112_03237 [Pandoraea horticolens]|uniref:Uncharacterized protein n=1 Tax=Pandoraea horticolens TaxID=2508298 RepID=A0A5E4WHP5_9BURK|nr:hypothetical protein [Pandoraea horticolens]VVE23114.1 hypothetical protein PHO31112_03237 [Pandoraea horticolens]